jgi:hypothetical protein
MGCTFVTRIVEAMLKVDHVWELIHYNVSDWIRECGVRQKIKQQRDPNCQDEVEHHLYCSNPLISLPEDEDGSKYVILVMDFSSFFLRVFILQVVKLLRSVSKP